MYKLRCKLHLISWHHETFSWFAWKLCVDFILHHLSNTKVNTVVNIPLEKWIEEKMAIHDVLFFVVAWFVLNCLNSFIVK